MATLRDLDLNPKSAKQFAAGNNMTFFFSEKIRLDISCEPLNNKIWKIRISSAAVVIYGTIGFLIIIFSFFLFLVSFFFLILHTEDIFIKINSCTQDAADLG